MLASQKQTNQKQATTIWKPISSPMPEDHLVTERGLATQEILEGVEYYFSF